MFVVKNNYRNKYPDLVCWGCGKNDETQQHVLEECETIHQTNTPGVTKRRIFTEDIKTLKETAKQIDRIIIQINKIEVIQKHK
jgi:hypothetical protein